MAQHNGSTNTMFPSTVSSVRVRKLSEIALLPIKGSAGAAGYDLFSIEEKVLEAWGTTVVSTGIAMEIPSGTYGRIAPRSGLALKGIDVLAGVIDSDYRGEIKVILSNFSDNPLSITKGMKIAQLLIEKCYDVKMSWTSELSASVRGKDGFGSTDKK